MKSSTERQRDYHARQRAAGLTKVSFYAPAADAAAFRSMESMYRQFNVEVVGIVIRNKSNGQVRTIRF